MPSRKVLAAVVGKTDQAAVSRGGTSTVRFAAAPKDVEGALAQEDLKSSVDQILEGTPFKGGKLLEIDFRASTSQTIAHGLGHPVNGFIVCDVRNLSSAMTIYREDEVTPSAIDFSRSKTHVKFLCTAAGSKVKVWVW
jgi:hypothetical protein